MANKLVNKIRIKRVKNYYKKLLKLDLTKYIDNFSLSGTLSNQKKAFERDILVLSHTIEKGLSHKKIKTLFGYAMVQELYNNILSYSKLEDNDDFILTIGVSSIIKYNAVNKSLDVPSEKLFDIPENLKKYGFKDVGAYEISKEDFFSKTNSDFLDFSNSRHSIRLYDEVSDDIEIETLNDCVKLAMNCPCACNRQAVKLKIVRDRNKIKEITDIQGGSRGFGQNAGAIIIATVDLNYYQHHERNIPLFDSGLFVMNLLYTLHYYKLGACVLNASFNETQMNRLQNIVKINDEELLASIVAVSNIPENSTVMLAKSEKKYIKDIVEYIK